MKKAALRGLGFEPALRAPRFVLATSAKSAADGGIRAPWRRSGARGGKRTSQGDAQDQMDAKEQEGKRRGVLYTPVLLVFVVGLRRTAGLCKSGLVAWKRNGWGRVNVGMEG